MSELPSLFADLEWNEDRTVYAFREDMQIVRYDRAGKWYEEGFTTSGTFYRRHIGVAEAARLARSAHLAINLGRPGGSAFDRKLRDE